MQVYPRPAASTPGSGTSPTPVVAAVLSPTAAGPEPLPAAVPPLMPDASLPEPVQAAVHGGPPRTSLGIGFRDSTGPTVQSAVDSQLELGSQRLDALVEVGGEDVLSIIREQIEPDKGHGGESIQDLVSFEGYSESEAAWFSRAEIAECGPFTISLPSWHGCSSFRNTSKKSQQQNVSHTWP